MDFTISLKNLSEVQKIIDENRGFSLFYFTIPIAESVG